jgi:hypothetical protein
MRLQPVDDEVVREFGQFSTSLLRHSDRRIVTLEVGRDDGQGRSTKDE